MAVYLQLAGADLAVELLITVRCGGPGPDAVVVVVAVAVTVVVSR